MAISGEVSGHKAYSPSLASLCCNTGNREEYLKMTNLYLRTAMNQEQCNAVYTVRPSFYKDSCTVAVHKKDQDEILISNYRCHYDPELKKWKLDMDSKSPEPQDKLEDLVEAVIPPDCNPINPSLTPHKFALLWEVNSNQLKDLFDQWAEIMKQLNHFPKTMYSAMDCFNKIEGIVQNNIEFEDVLEMGHQLTSFWDWVHVGEDIRGLNTAVVNFNGKEMKYTEWEDEFLINLFQKLDQIITTIAEDFQSPAAVIDQSEIDDLKWDFKEINSNSPLWFGSWNHIEKLAISDSTPDIFRLICKLRDVRNVAATNASKAGSEEWKEGTLKPFLSKLDDSIFGLIEKLKNNKRYAL